MKFLAQNLACNRVLSKHGYYLQNEGTSIHLSRLLGRLKKMMCGNTLVSSVALCKWHGLEQSSSEPQRRPDERRQVIAVGEHGTFREEHRLHGSNRIFVGLMI